MKQQTKKTQVVTCRIPVDTWHEYEIACIEDGRTMSQVIRRSISDYLNTRKRSKFVLPGE